MDAYRVVGRDGLELAYYEIGAGRPLILLSGFAGPASGGLDYGPAPVLAEQGYRVILPDFRGHGQSTTSHDPAAYPPDVLADDGLALIEHLGLGDGEYDHGGSFAAPELTAAMIAFLADGSGPHA